MDWASLDGLRAKLKRADEHLEALTAKIRAFVDSEPHTYGIQVDQDACRYSIRVSIKQEPPVRLGVICGDVVHCLRSALDHAVAALVPKVSRRTAFPIFGDADEFLCAVTIPARKGRQGPLGGLDPTGPLFAVIEACQPYHGEHGIDHHPLWVLRGLSNADKHRAILTALSSHRRNPALDFSAVDAEFVGKAAFVYDQPLKDGAEVLSGAYKVTGPSPEVKMRGNLPIEIAFGNELLTMQGLYDIRKAVWSLVIELAKRAGTPLPRD